MKNKLSIALGLSTIFIGSLPINATPKDNNVQKKNIVILFVDDLGYNDLGFRGGYFITPNIDKLRSESMSFSRSYTSISASSPSRASLLTGKNPVRIGMVRHIYNEKPESKKQTYSYLNVDPAHMPSLNWLPLEEITYAEKLHESNYYNYFIGKWHLGFKKYFPDKQGFDAIFGTTECGHPSNYYPPYFGKESDILNDVPKDAYLTDVLTDNAVNFIKDYNKDKPFTMSFFYYNVHTPMIGRKDLVKRYMKEVHLDKEKAEYAAKVTAVDESVGRIMNALKKSGKDKNTIIIFSSDQGGVGVNAPLRGEKNTPWDENMLEGGIRIPTLIKIPGVTKPNSTCSTPIQTIDIYPTIVEMATGKKCTDSQINGVSLMPLLEGKKIADRSLYFWRSYCDQYSAIIHGDWKLMKAHSGKYQLYNLKKDIGERNNLVNNPTYTKRFNNMKLQLKKWSIKNVPSYLKENGKFNP